MKTFKKNKHLFSAVIFLLSCFSILASDQDLTIKFMLDSSCAMRDQNIVESTATNLAAEISNFTGNQSRIRRDSSVKILVDLFWQESTSFKTQGVFDYRLGQSGAPNYDGLRELDLRSRIFVENETILNKLVNRNWPAGNKDTVMVVLTNSQETLEKNEIAEINKEAKKVRARLIIVTLPRKNNYSDEALKSEIAKRIHGAFEEINSYIGSLQFSMKVSASVNGKNVDPGNKITAVAPVKISMSAAVSEEKSFFWEYNGKKTAGKTFSLEIGDGSDFTVYAVGIDSLGVEHRQGVPFSILPVPSPEAKFSVFPVSGVAPLIVSVTDKSVNAQKYQWNWGDGTPGDDGKEPSHTYKTPGEYTVTLNILGVNGDTVAGTAKVKVSYPAPEAKFEAPSEVTADTAVEFGSQSKNATRWSWNFGDGSEGSQEEKPKHKFTKAGTYRVVLEVFNPDGLSAKSEKTINVVEKLVADFEYESSVRRVTFTNKSQGAEGYEWSFGDGETSTEESPVHTYSNKETKTFDVSLTAIGKNGQELTKTERISIHVEIPKVQPLAANFTYSQLPDAAVPTVKFTNTSVGAGRCSWDFGDGSTSTESSPTHVYNNITDVKDVNVTLVVKSADGRENKKVMSIRITPPPSGSSLGIILVVILIVGLIVIFIAVKLLKRGKSFTVTLFSRENKPVGKKIVRVGEIVQITSLNGGSDLDFQIVRADDDSGDDFKVRFRKPEESPAVVKQKAFKIRLNDQWSDAIDMSNLSVDSGRLVFSEGETEEGEE